MARLRLRDLRGLSRDARAQIRQALRAQLGEHEAARSIGGEDDSSLSKYHNVRTIIDGIAFASRHEALRYSELRLELQAGEITDLKLQKPYALDVNGIHVCDYIADFVYLRQGQRVVEDAKGERLEVYRLKKLLMRAIFGIEVLEV